MPPATTMSANDDMDPFGEFGQLSLDPYSQPPPPTAADGDQPMAPATPPNAPAPVNAFRNTQGPMMMMQQQPMQVSPEQPTDAYGQHQRQQQQGALYSNYQYNPYSQPPPMQTQQQQQYRSMVATTPDGDRPRPNGLTSPPISPLWTPASPDRSPPDGPRDARRGNGAMPTLPAGFGPAGGAASNPFHAGPAPAMAADPFGGGDAPPRQEPADDADFWNDMGFGAVAALPSDAALSVATPSVGSESAGRSPSSLSDDDDSAPPSLPVELDARGLPAGGEYYKARVAAPMLGAIFSSARELRSTLYKAASDSFVEAIGERPVISFTIDGGAADTAGIGLGHVLLGVNGKDVDRTDGAVRTVGAASRPMTMEFYAPNKEVRVVKTEGCCMVKYDNHSTEAPASACEWKAKYVVMGDMLGKPHILYMYRSKAEYDIAVRESQTRCRSLSVKVKQFDIRGARIFHERGSVQYPNKPRWHYFAVVRGTGLPIKISARTPEELHPVYEGISSFLDGEEGVRKARAEAGRERGTSHAAGGYRETYY